MKKQLYINHGSHLKLFSIFFKSTTSPWFKPGISAISCLTWILCPFVNCNFFGRMSILDEKLWKPQLLVQNKLNKQRTFIFMRINYEVNHYSINSIILYNFIRSQFIHTGVTYGVTYVIQKIPFFSPLVIKLGNSCNKFGQDLQSRAKVVLV